LTPLPGILRLGRRQVLTQKLFDDVVEHATVIGLLEAVLRTGHLQGNLVAPQMLEKEHELDGTATTRSNVSGWPITR
jgi:hypothetical protein